MRHVGATGCVGDHGGHHDDDALSGRRKADNLAGYLHNGRDSQALYGDATGLHGDASDPLGGDLESLPLGGEEMKGMWSEIANSCHGASQTPGVALIFRELKKSFSE